MAFEGLSAKLQGALRKMTGKGRLTEQAVKEGMREVGWPCWRRMSVRRGQVPSKR